MTTDLESVNAEVAILREREAAMREILQAISASRTDSGPVFETILKNAARLSGAPLANLVILNDMRSHWTLEAHFGEGLRHLTVGKTTRLLDSKLVPAVSMRTASIVQVEDLVDTDLYRQGDPGRVAMVEVEGMRTILGVPLLLDGEAIGCITLFRREVKAFTQDEIELVVTFAAQAVIAVENVRQFREVQERLMREKANREILEVISLNPDNEQPVFDAIINRAAKLCRAPHAGLLLRDADDRHLILAAANVEQSGYVDFLRANPHSMKDETSLSVEAVRSMEVRQYPDIEALAEGTAISNQLKNTWKLERMRTLLYVPLIKGDRAIGVIALYRLHVEEFSNDDIEILKLFAAQAVIAIDNVRQFKELENLNAELGDRVKSQVGELERLGRLKRFLPSAVADAVVSAGDDSMLSSHRALIATLFCDMRGFTAFCEAAEPEETIEILQTYHQEMSELIDQYGGGVDQRAGDGIMIIFNDPIPCDDPAGCAVQLALAMRAKMRELCAKWRKLGHRLGFGVGISFGYATVGIVGSAGRYDYTASGTSINTAARLCDMAANDEILISPRTWAAVEGAIQAESRGEVEMKGIREPVEVFAVVAD
ncbi:GAF domain-containing protein [Ruegeria arenilitoris]|uniref:GAF domain-containing protein n=1 Tax=Ruegeria arenilitoris TaxID=1173585 RepID=UPI00147E10FA